MTLTRSSLSGNTATGNGGGLANAGTAPSATFTRSPLSDNTALLNGGAVYNGRRGTVTATRAPISANIANNCVSSAPAVPDRTG